jgi:hypothetical protein
MEATPSRGGVHGETHMRQWDLPRPAPLISPHQRKC